MTEVVKKLIGTFRPVAKAEKAQAPREPQSFGVPAEVVAAISGAVAAYCGEGAVVTGIKRASKRASWRGAGDGRSAWSAAGLSELTRPFSAK